MFCDSPLVRSKAGVALVLLVMRRRRVAAGFGIEQVSGLLKARPVQRGAKLGDLPGLGTSVRVCYGGEGATFVWTRQECMIAADEYYSKQRLEPPGSRASWWLSCMQLGALRQSTMPRNARDQHMMTTILRLRAQSRELFGIDGQVRKEFAVLRSFSTLRWQDLKIIIWAHNSHVGDATATPMGGMEFQRNESPCKILFGSGFWRRVS